jgi:hypothetical protein
MPASAYAVSVSSSNGSGTQYRTTSYGNGAAVNGDLKSTQGYAVYYQGRVDLGGCNDVTVGRYASNVTSLTPVQRSGTIATTKGPFCSFQGVRSKVCRDISGAPDSCGGWSLRY